jgi:uncharacterized membrane protein affecting hemolysin expression
MVKMIILVVALVSIAMVGSQAIVKNTNLDTPTTVNEAQKLWEKRNG